MAEKVGFVPGEPSFEGFVQDLAYADSEEKREERRAEFVREANASAEAAIIAGLPIPDKMVCPIF
jgi:hypothetical protein